MHWRRKGCRRTGLLAFTNLMFRRGEIHGMRYRSGVLGRFYHHLLRAMLALFIFFFFQATKTGPIANMHIFGTRLVFRLTSFHFTRLILLYYSLYPLLLFVIPCAFSVTLCKSRVPLASHWSCLLMSFLVLRPGAGRSSWWSAPAAGCETSAWLVCGG
jgi:hypothetical protein